MSSKAEYKTLVDNMKILFVPTSYPDESNPTRDIFIQEQAVALSKAGHDIRVLHAQKQPSKKILSKIDKNIKTVSDSYVIRYSVPVKTLMEDRFILPNKRAFLKTIKSLYVSATADGWKPDVIYAHFSCWAGYAATELGKKYDIPVVVMEHYSGFMSESVPKKMIQGLKKVVDTADAFICVSNNLKTSVIQKTKTNRSIDVIPNMLDPSFKYVDHVLKDKFVFCAVCNLNERKRVKELVIAFCKAFDRDTQVRLIIGGDGPEYKKISEYIISNGREEQILMLGRLDRKGTVELYNKSNCFVLVSAHETFGIVWREAMSTGLPVITSNHEGWSVLDWSDDFGIMVPVDNEEQLISALKTMQKNHGRFDGLSISKYCQKHYSEAAVVRQIEAVFNRVC